MPRAKTGDSHQEPRLPPEAHHTWHLPPSAGPTEPTGTAGTFPCGRAALRVTLTLRVCSAHTYLRHMAPRPTSGQRKPEERLGQERPPWQLCGLEIVTQPLCAWVSPSVSAATPVAPVGLNKPISCREQAFKHVATVTTTHRCDTTPPRVPVRELKCRQPPRSLRRSLDAAFASFTSQVPHEQPSKQADDKATAGETAVGPGPLPGRRVPAPPRPSPPGSLPGLPGPVWDTAHRQAAHCLLQEKPLPFPQRLPGSSELARSSSGSWGMGAASCPPCQPSLFCPSHCTSLPGRGAGPYLQSTCRVMSTPVPHSLPQILTGQQLLTTHPGPGAAGTETPLAAQGGPRGAAKGNASAGLGQAAGPHLCSL